MDSVGQDYDYLFKILLVGESGVGKSCLLLRYADDSFTDAFISTIGVDFKIKTVTINDKTVKLQIWDTAGQERFRTITTTYYRGAHGVILAYDITDRVSFSRLPNWLAEIQRFAKEDVVILLVGTKLDLAEKREVSTQEGKDFAAKHNMQFLEASSKSKMGVDEAFSTLGTTIISKQSRAAMDRKTGVPLGPTKPVASSSCC